MNKIHPRRIKTKIKTQQISNIILFYHFFMIKYLKNYIKKNI